MHDSLDYFSDIRLRLAPEAFLRRRLGSSRYPVLSIPVHDSHPCILLLHVKTVYYKH